MIGGLSLAAVPLFTQLYPWYFILNCIRTMSAYISIQSPFLPDYVQKDSLGVASLYQQLIINCAFLFSSSGLYAINAHVDV